LQRSPDLSQDLLPVLVSRRVNTSAHSLIDVTVVPRLHPSAFGRLIVVILTDLVALDIVWNVEAGDLFVLIQVALCSEDTFALLKLSIRPHLEYIALGQIHG